MQTRFSAAQLADPRLAESEKILRKCVHCGFCTATCPTYLTLGNELDSPRGRIYLIKEMLENDRPADAETVTHIDRCLSCLSCTTTCPSGVDYMHLVDHARIHIENTYKRPLITRLIRLMLAMTLPYPARLRQALRLARFGQPLLPLLRFAPALRPLVAMLELAPRALPEKGEAVFGQEARQKQKGRAAELFKNRDICSRPFKREKLFPSSVKVPQSARVALLSGCAQQVLSPGINAATRALLERSAVEVVMPENEGCCGALVHHMGREAQALTLARHNIDVWSREIERGGLEAIIITASGCGTTIKDYAHMLRLDPNYAEKAAQVAALAKDITEYLATLNLPQLADKGLRIAYHSACSMQHGQKITLLPKQLLQAAGFSVVTPAEGHLCCGSAGTYNILQPEIATRLRMRKAHNLEATKADIITAGNLGCMTQIANATKIPILHTVELLNWAYGGVRPEKIAHLVPETAAEVMRGEAL